MGEHEVTADAVEVENTDAAETAAESTEAADDSAENVSDEQ